MVTGVQTCALPIYFYLADWLEYAIRMFGVLPDFVDLKGLEKYRIQSQADLARAFVEEKNRAFAERTLDYTTSEGRKIKLSLLDIEKRLFDLSFDPNHPPELRWGAPLGSEERASAPETYTRVPSGARIPMERAYQLEAFYRTLGQRETESSYLQEMFTEGFPIRDKLDLQVGKWSYATKPVRTQPAGEKPPPQRDRNPGAAKTTASEGSAAPAPARKAS